MVTLKHIITGGSAHVLPLAVYVPGDVEGVRRRAEQPALREADGVEPVPPSPAVGEGDPGHALAREHLASVLQNEARS